MHIVLTTASLLLAMTQIAQASGPVCRYPTVVDEISREVRARDYYTSVNPALITEQATPLANVVQCQVCVLAAPYNTLRFGERPIRQCRPHAFEVRILPAGFVVRDLP